MGAHITCRKVYLQLKVSAERYVLVHYPYMTLRIAMNINRCNICFNIINIMMNIGKDFMCVIHYVIISVDVRVMVRYFHKFIDY